MKNKELNNLLKYRKIDLDLIKEKRIDNYTNDTKNRIAVLFYNKTDSNKYTKTKIKYNDPLVCKINELGNESYQDISESSENKLSFNQLQKIYKNFDLIDFKTNFNSQTLPVIIPYGLYGFINGNYSMAKRIFSYSEGVENNPVEAYRVYGQTIDTYLQFFKNDNNPYGRYVIGTPIEKIKIHNIIKKRCNFAMNMGENVYATFSWNPNSVNRIKNQVYNGDKDSKFTWLNKPDRYRLLNFNSLKKIEEFSNYVKYFDGISTRYGTYDNMSLGENDDVICEYIINEPSQKHLGLDATVSNTYTNRYTLRYNKTKNIVLGMTYKDKLPYCRLLENNNLVNYYRKPIGDDGRNVQVKLQRWNTPNNSGNFNWINDYWWKRVDRNYTKNKYSTQVWCVYARSSKDWWWSDTEYDAYFAMGWIGTNDYNEIISYYQECFENDNDRGTGNSYGYNESRKYQYSDVHRDASSSWVSITDY